LNICIYGAASREIDRTYITAAESFGRMLAQRGHGIVFGGGAGGMMGAAARGVYECNGSIIGVAPSFFNVDGALFENCTELIFTDTMRERKQIMEDRSDAFVMLPGGIGTFEEFFEILTLKQLGRHGKAIAVYNINGYYDDMASFINHAIDEHFVRQENLGLFEMFSDCHTTLDYIEQYQTHFADIETMRGIKT
jgi:uncharacterized protein (TIGR00730 family)